MSHSFIVKDRLHVPYYIFIRCGGRYSDADLLELFSLPTYRPNLSALRRGIYTLIADDGPWTLLADDWRYTLWHMPSTRPAIYQLGQDFEVFAASLGDCDYSFDFVYYNHGRLVRQYTVEDPDLRGGRVVENIGDPLPGETAELFLVDERRIVLGVAASVGINTDFIDREIRVYGPVP